MDHTSLFLIAVSVWCLSLLIENIDYVRYGYNRSPTICMGLDVTAVIFWMSGLVTWLT